jgi:S-adenosylmethionine:tRNA ribosyltransferase-isomerase
MKIEDFDYFLPPEQIAQHPIEPRDRSKLLICAADGKLSEWQSSFSFRHKVFRDLVDDLTDRDWLVMNDAKVLPIRMLGHREIGRGEEGQTGFAGPASKGGAVEALLLRKLGAREWTALMHMSAKLKPGMRFIFEPGVVAEAISTHEERVANEGEVRLRFGGMALDRAFASGREDALEQWLERHGHVPLPPYVERSDSEKDKKTYQTVYAAKTGSAAAPTAGFHFTSELLERVAAKGIKTSRVTLHVGIGTFRPIKTSTLEEHVMHEETFEISPEFAEEFAAARASGKRVVAVGTTVVRTLESWVRMSPELKPGVYKTRIFIHPGVRFEAVDDLITNFHLPKSSLLVLVGAAMGMEPMHEAYRQALASGYRFFSYGDAMFIRGRARS